MYHFSDGPRASRKPPELDELSLPRLCPPPGVVEPIGADGMPGERDSGDVDGSE